MHASLSNFFLNRLKGCLNKNFAEPSADDSALLLDAFNLPPEEAIKLFEAKGYKITWSWKDMQKEAHAKAFTVAKIMKLDILKDVRDEVDKAIKNGTTLKTFQDNLTPILQAKGWWGKRPDFQVPKDDNQPLHTSWKLVQLGSPWRLETIFRTNIQTSYMAGRYKGLKDVAKQRPYWQYMAVLDKATRPAHAAMNGRIYKHNDPVWSKWYPPAGYNCRCRIRSLSEYELQKMGLKEKVLNSFVNGMTVYEPDKGWDYNPGESGQKYLEELAGNKQQLLQALLPKPIVIEKPEAKPVIEEQKSEQKKPETLDEFISAGGEIVKEIFEELKTDEPEADKFREVLREKLSRVREIGLEVKTDNAGPSAKVINEVSKWYPREWVEKMDSLGPLHVKTNKRRRSFAVTIEKSGIHRILGVGYLPDSKAGEGYIVLKDNDRATALHELTHRLQYAMPELQARFKELHERRTKDEKLETLRSLTGIEYPIREKAKKDNYVHPYFGKEYDGEPRETMAMSFEYVLENNSDEENEWKKTNGFLSVGKSFNKLLQLDVELLQLVIGVMFHV